MRGLPPRPPPLISFFNAGLCTVHRLTQVGANTCCVAPLLACETPSMGFTDDAAARWGSANTGGVRSTGLGHAVSSSALAAQEYSPPSSEEA